MWESIYTGGSFVLLYLVIYFVAKIINDALTPYDVDHELTTSDNPALAVSFSGYIIAVTAIYIGALLGPSKGLMEDLIYCGGYAMLGVVLLNLSRIINDKIIFYKFCNVKEIIEDRNVGTGAIQFGSYVASGLIVAGSVHGQGGGIHTVLACYFAGQVVLVIFAKIYNVLLPFDMHDEIEKDNAALGVGVAGNFAAVGLILMRGTDGDFVSWSANGTTFCYAAIAAVIAIPVVRFFFDKLIIRGSKLNHEILNDRNIGAGILEMVTAMSFAALIFNLL